MDKGKLSSALRNLASALDIDTACPSHEQAEIRDGAELIRVLARVVEGQTLAHAFGAPGNWGYETPIGDALASRG